MRVLIVRLSSLGDVVHALPVVDDILAAHPQALIDWAVEPAFAPIIARVRGVAATIECPLRRWSRDGWLAAPTRAGIAALARRLRRDRYDAVVDLQGLTKSALVARLARGPVWGLANRTMGSSHEWPARVLATHAVRVEPASHAVDRSRELVRHALGTSTDSPPVFGLVAASAPTGTGALPPVVFVHGSSRADKLWPEPHWIELGRRLVDAGHTIALPHADPAEGARAERIAAALGVAATVWPALPLGELIDRMAASAGVVGVDSGPSHLATALDLPHVQIYNHPTAWRTGPLERHGQRRQRAVEASPTVDAVWAAWHLVAARPG